MSDKVAKLPDPEVFADQILDVTNQRSPPTDIRGILSRWPRLSIVETDLDGDGMFVDLGRIGGEILVRKDKHESRKRFTIAHELGHFLLRHHITDADAFQSIENWCNNFAAGVLLPREMVARHLREGGIGDLTQRLVDGPGIFQVSRQAFFMRVTRLYPVSIFVFLISESSTAMLECFQSKEFLEGDLDKGAREFLACLSEKQSAKEQHELRQANKIFVGREIQRYPNDRKKVLLAVIER